MKASSAMTVQVVAVYLNVDAKTIYRLAKRGDIPGFKVAGTWRFKREDIERWIEERKVLSLKPRAGRTATGPRTQAR